MNSVIDRYRRRQASSPTHCEPIPEQCSICGMLECVCRPRFFAGQMLTADDLNRLDYYIRAKHRLHNRQLHGWGVVNGLEVTCDACGKGVVVGCGYALSPCGEDIVVCEPVVVDVCALIKACKEAERGQPCEPPRHPTPSGCEDAETEWVLSIRYAETPTRAVQPLMPSTVACGCANGQCTCKNGTAKAKPRGAPVQCEPTVICEGFAFDVYRKPPELDQSNDDNPLQLNPDSELYQRFECCVELLTRRIPKPPGPSNLRNVQENLSGWHQWLCSFKDHLQIYLASKPGYNCELLARLNTIVCPPITSDNAATLVFQAAALLFLVWLDALLACFCSALLPPCPSAHPDGSVPLATFRVSGNPCRVLSICNWTRHRKFATTFPALQYWLSILPYGVELRRVIERMCCFEITSVFPPRPDTHVPEIPGVPSQPAGNSSSGVSPTAGGASEFASSQPMLYERASKRLNPRPANPDRLNAASRIAAESFARGDGLLDPQKLFESVLLRNKDKGEDRLSALELDNLPQFLVLSQVLRPIAVGAVAKDALGPALAAMGLGGLAAAAPPEEAPEVAALRKEMEAMRADLAKQADEINRLKETRRQEG